MRHSTIAPLLCFAASALLGDTLTLRNGQAVTGTYLGGSAREIRMDLGDHIQSYSIEQISGLQFDSGPGAAAAPPPSFSNNQGVPPPAPQPQQQAQTYGSNVPPPPGSASAGASSYPDTAPPVPGPAASAPAGITIPAGTLVTVRMIDAVDSDSSRLGRTYRGSVDEPVMVNGQTVIPRGADVVTKIVEDQQSGKITGQTAISLALLTVTVNGVPVPVSSQDVREASGSRGARSAGVIGGTTALGAIIGAVAGGGRGAAIGAASGAAVGTGAQIATHGQRVKIPSESRLVFTTTNPVNL